LIGIDPCVDFSTFKVEGCEVPSGIKTGEEYNAFLLVEKIPLEIPKKVSQLCDNWSSRPNFGILYYPLLSTIDFEWVATPAGLELLLGGFNISVFQNGLIYLSSEFKKEEE
jgi:hypothetical protein